MTIAEQIADAIQRTRETTGACTRSDLRCWGFTDAEIEAHAPYDDPPLHPRSAERILREQAAEIERLRAVVMRFKLSLSMTIHGMSAHPIAQEHIDERIAEIEAGIFHIGQGVIDASKP
jgi:hypothetical protein